MSKIGYIRVSTADQNTDRQTDALKAQGVDRVFLEKISGATANRPELKAMLDYVREGDTLVIESISRLARSTRDLLRIIDELREKGVDLLSLKESIDTQTPQGRFVLSIFAALSELERDTIRERQKEGIEAARRRGKHLGRPRIIEPDNWAAVYEKWKSGMIPAVGAMKTLDLSKATFYRLVKRHEEGN
jgi:DNA invertase Pin-like site-specific DNA recombinase